MAGEKGTEIRDDAAATVVMGNDRNRHHKEITLHSHTVYLIRIQLDCPGQLRTELTQRGCNLAQDVNVWIDINDDGQFDESEVGAPYRWPVTSYLPEGIYDLQIHVPMIDERYTRSGQHKMRVAISPSEYYRTHCGYSTYTETREYSVNIIPRRKYSGKYASIVKSENFSDKCIEF